nr:hypothetical protein [Okeania sp. SIO2F4]
MTYKKHSLLKQTIKQCQNRVSQQILMIIDRNTEEFSSSERSL